MSEQMPPGVSPYVARGPVAHEIHALRMSIIIANVTTLLLGMFVAFFMVRAFNRVDSAATTAQHIQTLQQQLVTNTAIIQDLQQQQVTSTTTGRALLQQVATLNLVIAQQTSPTATAQQQEKVAGYLMSLTNAQKTLNADQLRKLGELAEALGAPPAAVQRILAEPVPVITFGPPAPTPPPTSPSSPPARTASSPQPTLSPAVNLQVQCLVVCPSPRP